MRLFVWIQVATLAATSWPPSGQAQEPITTPAATSPSQAGHEYTAPPPIPSDADVLLREPQATSEVTGNYTLDEMLGLACRNNPTLRQARTHISAELGKALQAGLYPNPVFSYEGEQIFLDVEGDKDSPGEFQGGMLEQRIVTAGKLRLSREKYMRRAHVAEHLAVAQQFRVCNDVRVHFYLTLAAQQKLQILRELLKTAEDSAVTAQEAYNMGQANRPAVRRTNVRLQQARLAVMDAENKYYEHFRALTSLVGVQVTTGEVQGTLDTQHPTVSFDAALSRLLTDSPELAAARAKLSSDRVTVRRESVQWVPDVVLRGGTGYNYDAKETTAMASVAIEVPLYDRNQGTIQQAQADYVRQRQEIERVELSLRNRLASVYQQYLTADQHAAQYEEYILPELKAAYIELLESYKQHRVNWSEVLQSQHDYFDARLTQVDNLVAVRTQEVAIYGFLLHDGLMAAPGITPPGHIDAVSKPR